jgi:hypothetical protein
MLLLVGCSAWADRVIAEQDARRAADNAAQLHIEATRPRCTHPRQCEAMWTAARDWINETCAFKIQTATDNMLETFNGLDNSAGLSCRATKAPLPEGGYLFEAHASCAVCVITPVSAVQSFNDKLAAAGAAFTD